MLGRKRRNSLTGVAHRIAMRLHEVSKPFIDRGESTPPEVLAHEFRAVCEEFEDMHGSPLSTAEMQTLASRLVPKAIGQITKRIQRTADFIGGLADSMARENARAAA